MDVATRTVDNASQCGPATAQRHGVEPKEQRLHYLSSYFRHSRRTSGMAVQQRPLGDDQISQSEQAQLLCRVLGKPFVTRLPMSKKVLDHVERMLDLGADAGLHFLRTLGQELGFDELVELAPLADAWPRARSSPSLRLSYERPGSQRLRRPPAPHHAATLPATLRSLTLAAVPTKVCTSPDCASTPMFEVGGNVVTPHALGRR